MAALERIGFGGGCHWCTEAVFQSLKGVENVEQGWIASEGESSAFSEAVIVTFNPLLISIEILIEIHLHTHKSTSEHSMRKKYRSAIYYFTEGDHEKITAIINAFQPNFKNRLITQVLSYNGFKLSDENFKDYYYKNPQKPFCESFIDPKLKLLLEKFSTYTDDSKMAHLKPLVA